MAYKSGQLMVPNAYDIICFTNSMMIDIQINVFVLTKNEIPQWENYQDVTTLHSQLSKTHLSPFLPFDGPNHVLYETISHIGGCSRAFSGQMVMFQAVDGFTKDSPPGPRSLGSIGEEDLCGVSGVYCRY